MGLTEKQIDKKVYLYFEMAVDGGKTSLYLGPRDSPKPDRVRVAISYLQGRIESYHKELDALKRLLKESSH